MKDLFKGCWTIPNLLSFLRIVIVPFFAYFFLNNQLTLAVIMLAISGFSDRVYKFKSFLINRSFLLEKSYPYVSSLLFGNNNYLMILFHCLRQWGLAQ